MRILMASVMLVWLSSIALAQSTETVLYTFGAYPTDGVTPEGGLLADSSGNLYGITSGGGGYCISQGGCGTAYELSPSEGGVWAETILYNFCLTGNPFTCVDGAVPYSGLIRDGAGNLYGSTYSGGASGYGTVFRLSPPPGGVGNWSETVLWSFAPNEKNNGWAPGNGKLNMDASGNIYGTTQQGGSANKGIVFELSPVGDGTYNFAILRSFSGDNGANPQYGVAIDTAGNLFGTTEQGGIANENCNVQCGLVYELSLVNGVWMETVLYKFNGISGSNPISPISFDHDGNLYGTLSIGNASCDYNCGGVFRLTPKAGGGFTRSTFFFNGQDGEQPLGGVLISGDALYGTTYGAHNAFSIGHGAETVLYTFPYGQGPDGGTLIEREGILYGVTPDGGGENNAGVAYSLTK